MPCERVGQMTRWCFTCAAAVLAGAIATSCAKQDAQFSPPPAEFPVLHGRPTWISADELAFEDSGADEAGPGWWSVDETRAGIVLLNLATGRHTMAIPHGIFPSASAFTGELVAQAGLNGGLVSYADSQATALGEPRLWHKRSQLTLSASGRHCAWRSWGDDADVGIWVFERATDALVYLGSGQSPAWSATDERLMYATRSRNGLSCLVEYDCTSATRDTIIEFGPNEGPKDPAYSPDGASVAFIHQRAASGDELCVLDLSTRAVHSLLPVSAEGIAWGARGIAFGNNCGSADDPGCGVLWILNPATGSMSQLTRRFEFTR